MVDAQHLPHGRRQAGDRHLKFHETRDNLVCHDGDDTDLTSWSQVELAKFRPGRSEFGACAQACESLGALGPAT